MPKRAKNIYLLMDRSDVKELEARPIDENIKGLLRLLTIPEYDYLDTDKYFENNGIPVDFRKIVVILHRPFTSNKEAEELFTGIPFDVSGYTRFVKDRSKQMFSGRTYDNRGIMFTTKANNLVDFDIIRMFYLSLLKNNLFENYINSVNDLFKADYSLDEVKENIKIKKLEP